VPDLTCLAFAGPQSFGPLSIVAFVSDAAHHLIIALRYPWVITLIVCVCAFLEGECACVGDFINLKDLSAQSSKVVIQVGLACVHS
jgi:hypothetical protein